MRVELSLGLWPLLLCLSLAACAPQPRYSLQTQSALEQLDQDVAQKGRYQAWRQTQIDELRLRVKAESSPDRRAERLYAVSQSYITFNLDSAAYYVDRISQLAEQHDSSVARRLALLADIDVWLGRGQVRLAEEILRKVDTLAMTPMERAAWHGRWFAVLHRRQSESTDSVVRRFWADSLALLRRMVVVGQSEPTRARMDAAILCDSGRYDEAIQLLEPFTTKNLSFPRVAILYYTLADVASLQGDQDALIRYLAQSSIADLRAGTRSYASLYDLSLRLLDAKEYDRAAAYMECAFRDAMLCKSVARIPASSFAAIKISETVSSNIAERQQLMVWFVAMAVLFLLVVTGVLWFVLWQHRRLRSSHQQLVDLSDQLQDRNDELHGKNEQIHDINTALVDSNRIKDRYVGHYIDLSAGYINQMEAFRREVCRIAKTKGAEELVRQLNSSREISGEFQKFYQTFDASFLDIFPHFIEQVNALLQPEARFAPRTGAALTTELRILAAMRLGVADSGHIASLLNCASATVYTYRTKLRNAALDREHFEEQVARIGF